MSAEENNKYFWLAYAKAIQEAVGGPVGKDSAIFFATKTQKGPLASSLIPAPYTNSGLYSIGDNLLSVDNLFYIPSTQHSYIRSLKTYLSWVDPGGDNSDSINTQVVLTTQALDAALKRYKTEEDNAMTQYTKEKSFAQWYPNNNPVFANARDELNAARTANKSAIADINGPYADQLGKDQNAINSAMTSNVPIPGFAMAINGSAPPTAAEIHTAFNNTTPLPNPATLKYVPEYNSPEYTNTVKDWMGQLSRGRPGKNSITIDINKGKNVKESEFGQVGFDANAGFEYFPWISFITDMSTEKEYAAHDKDVNYHDIEVDLTYDEIRQVPISPGSWNIGNPKDSYPNLKPGAPTTVQTLVLPTQIVLVKNLGYKIKFKNKSKEFIDRAVTTVNYQDGIFRLFGVPIKVAGSRTEGSESHSHTVHWDKDSGEFVVSPTDDGSFATVIALVGDKIKTI